MPGFLKFKILGEIAQRRGGAFGAFHERHARVTQRQKNVGVHRTADHGAEDGDRFVAVRRGLLDDRGKARAALQLLRPGIVGLKIDRDEVDIGIVDQALEQPWKNLVVVEHGAGAVERIVHVAEVGDRCLQL